MKRRINLFSQRSSSRRISAYVKKAHKGALILFVVMIVVLGALGATYLILSRIQSTLDKKQQTYDRFVVLNKSFNASLRQFVFKYNLIQSYLKDDAESFSYYSSLRKVLAIPQSPVELSSFSIDNEQKVTFQLHFANYSDAISYMEQIETTSFLDHFEKLNVNSFNVLSEGSGYDLQLSGTFAPQI